MQDIRYTYTNRQRQSSSSPQRCIGPVLLVFFLFKIVELDKHTCSMLPREDATRCAAAASDNHIFDWLLSRTIRNKVLECIYYTICTSISMIKAE